MAPWPDLPHDLVAAIAKRLVLLEDFIAYGAVCRSWNSAATRENFTSTHQVPWLMLPETEGTTVRDFCNLKNRKVYHLNMPESFKGDVMFHSSLGWLMAQSIDGKVDLWHPFNGARIELPSIETFKNQHSASVLKGISDHGDDFEFLENFALSSNPSLTSDYMVVIQGAWRLAFCKAGDREWTAIETIFVLDEGHSDVAYYKGKFYVVESDSSILVCEIEEGKQPKTRVVVPPLPSQLCVLALYYLVDSAGALLLVERSVGEERLEFRVYEVPLNTGNWSKSNAITDLGNKTLFLSCDDSSFCVEPSDYYGCKSNCIYFSVTRRMFESKDYAPYEIYHMEDGIIETDLGKNSNSGKCPIVLIEPSF